MADEQYRWLDRGTAERFLNGEPPESADPTTRDQAERLAGTLRSLAAPPPSADEELPGEAAAMAAFRKLREEHQGQSGADPQAVHQAAETAADVGLIRLGATHDDRSGTADGPGRPRFLRLGLAAAVVAGMVGGAAALAGAGVLPTPSDDPDADPAASVTATPSPPGRLLVSPPPDGGEAGRSKDAGNGGKGTDAHGGDDTGPDGPGASGKNGSDAGDSAARSGHGSKQTVSACRDLRDGKQLNDARRRLLEQEAGGPSHVHGYCEDTLAGDEADDAHTTTGSGSGDGDDEGNGKNKGKGNGNNGKAKGQGENHGQGNGKGKNNGNGKNNGKGHGADKNKGHGSGQGDNGKQNQGNGPGNNAGNNP